MPLEFQISPHQAGSPALVALPLLIFGAAQHGRLERAQPAVIMAVQATLASLFVSQLLGACGDAVGSRLCRVVYGGSPARMILGTCVIGVLLTMAFLVTLHFTDIAKVRFGPIMLSPDLWIANGVLAATYNTGEAYLLLYSFGAVIKSITPLSAPLALWIAERRGLFGPAPVAVSTSGLELLNFALGTVGAVLMVSLNWGKHKSSEKGASSSSEAPDAVMPRTFDDRSRKSAAAKVVGTSTVVPATVTLVLCNTGWNALQRASFTKYNVNQHEWVFIDKVIGGIFALAFLAARAFISGERMEWGKALQETVASRFAVFAASGYVLLQLLRISLVFTIVGAGSSGVSTSTFLVTVVRVLLATLCNLLITWLAPAFLNLPKEDVEHLMSSKSLLKAGAGGALIAISVFIWSARASILSMPTVTLTAVHARPEPPVLLAIGDWGVAQGNGTGAVPRAMAEFTGDGSAVVLNFGDSFYPDGVSDDGGLLSRESAYASMFGKQLAAQQWHSVLGNHDYRGNATLITARSWLGYARTGENNRHSWSTWYEPRYDTIFVALDTNFLQKEVICTHLSYSDSNTQTCLERMGAMQATQTAWLKTVLANAQKRNVSWCIVFGHHPIFGSGKWAFYEADKAAAAALFAPLFEKYEVSLYMSGHDHVQQLYERAGVYYAISGAGGAELDDAPFEDLAGVINKNATLHVTDASHGFMALHFDLDAGLACIQFLSVQPSKNKCRTSQECRHLCKLGSSICHCMLSKRKVVRNESSVDVKEKLTILRKLDRLHGLVDDKTLKKKSLAVAKKMRTTSSAAPGRAITTRPTIALSAAPAPLLLAPNTTDPTLSPSAPRLAPLGSPDPWCQVRLSMLKTVGAGWMLKLPVIHNNHEFEASPWRAYVDHLYGPLQTGDFPVDLRCFEFWWVAQVPKRLWHTFFENRAMMSHAVGKSVDRLHGHPMQVNFYGTVAQHTLRMQQDHSRDHNRRHHHFPVLAKKTLESNTRIEVYHDGTDCQNRDDFVGYWVYFAPGSGIWVNLGKTMTFSNYNDACKHFVSDSNPICNVCCTPLHKLLMPAARAAGYDTLQFVDAQSGGKKYPTFEIVLLVTPCDASGEIAWASNPTPMISADLMTVDQGVCPPHGLLTRGRSAPRPCVCDVSGFTVNCVGGDTGGIGRGGDYEAEPTNVSVGPPCIKSTAMGQDHRVRCL